ELMRLVPQRYAEMYDFRCPDSTGFQRALKTTQAEAERDAAAMLDAWPASPTPAQRRRLAMLLLAAGDRPSAQVQWLRLAEPERIAGDALTKQALVVRDRAQPVLYASLYSPASGPARSRPLRTRSVHTHT